MTLPPHRALTRVKGARRSPPSEQAERGVIAAPPREPRHSARPEPCASAIGAPPWAGPGDRVEFLLRRRVPVDRPVIYLVDGTYNIFRAYHATPRLTTSKGQPTNAVLVFANILRKL